MRAGWNLSAADIIYQERTLSFSGSRRSIKEPSVALMDVGEASIRKLGFESKERRFVFIYCDVYRRLRRVLFNQRLDFGGFEFLGIHLILKGRRRMAVYWCVNTKTVRRYDEVDETARSWVSLDELPYFWIPRTPRPQGWCVAVKYQPLWETNSSSNEAAFDCVIHSNTQIFIAVFVKAGRISAASRSRARPCSGAKGWCERTHKLFHHISTQVDQFKQVLWSRHSGTKTSLWLYQGLFSPSALRNASHYCVALTKGN